jgi:hypothetical protein
MARRKRPTSQRPKAEWSDAAVVALLAWFDHTLQHEDLDFRSTVADHLGHTYTITQIDWKLSKLWHDHAAPYVPGLPHTTWKADFNTQGSSCLKAENGFEKALQEQIENSVKRLEADYAAKQLSPQIRRFRSSSRLNELSSNREIAVNASRAARTQTPQKLRPRDQTKSLTPSNIKQEIQSPLARQLSAKKRKRRLPKKVRTSVGSCI